MLAVCLGSNSEYRFNRAIATAQLSNRPWVQFEPRACTIRIYIRALAPAGCHIDVLHQNGDVIMHIGGVATFNTYSVTGKVSRVYRPAITQF